MVERLRLKLGAVRIARGPGALEFTSKFRRWLPAASAVSLGVALWRLAYDLQLAGRFAISDGLFSHWQVWLAMALLFQILDVMLDRFGHGGAATP